MFGYIYIYIYIYTYIHATTHFIGVVNVQNIIIRMYAIIILLRSIQRRSNLYSTQILYAIFIQV